MKGGSSNNSQSGDPVMAAAKAASEMTPEQREAAARGAVAAHGAATAVYERTKSDAKYGIPPGISNYGNSESALFIISSGNSVNPSPFSPHTPIGALRNPESGI